MSRGKPLDADCNHYTMTTSLFSPSALEKLVNETLPADAKPGEKVVVGTIDSSGAQVLVSFKHMPTEKGLFWEVQAAARHDWSGDHSVGAKVLLRW